MLVTPIACLRDNYAYLICADGEKAALCIDPSEAGPVLLALEHAGLELAGILNTHHHWDHVGGNQELLARTGDLPVYGHASDRERIPGQNRFLEDGDEFDLAGMHFRILHIPGHTMGAVAYIIEDAVFTGDTLFAAGCGRLFEGTPADMYQSLNIKLGSLSDATRVYCGHEYTASNLRFAEHVEPGNAAVREKAASVAKLRARGEPTVPSTMGEERLTNPFLRCDSEEIIQSVRSRLGSNINPVDVLGAVRAAKDAF
jgi:hydroxyacylglutathione hydrolase